MRNVLQLPSAEHLLGTDKLGRDTLSRIIAGTQVSLFMTICLVILLAIGGSIVAFLGVVLAIAIAGILGASVVNTILALLIVGWAKYARLVRSLVIKLRKYCYIFCRWSS